MLRLYGSFSEGFIRALQDFRLGLLDFGCSGLPFASGLGDRYFEVYNGIAETTYRCC